MRIPLFALVIMSWTASSAAAAPARYPIDAEELSRLRTRNPHAAELLEQGEALAIGGAVQEADELFQQSEREDPNCSLTHRRDCEALTALGKKDEAARACSRALSVMHSNPNVRAVVRALVDGPTAPTTEQVFQALTFTAAEQDRAPGAPTPAAAACDIAERIGDGRMRQHCAQDLHRMAPDDPETRRAMALLESRCPPWRFWLGWSSILAAIVVTLGHGAVARRRAAAAAAVVCALLASSSGTAWAGTPAAPAGGWLSKWHVDANDPASSIPSEKARNADPLEFGYWLQDVALWAEHASSTGDHAAAVKFYGVLAQVVPDRAVAFVKLCEEYEAMGDVQKAIGSCGDALLRDGTTVKDYAHFVHLVLSKPGLPTEKERAALGQVIEHMKADPAGHPAVDQLECEVGTRLSNVAQLRECTAALAASAPDDPRTISYEWDLAVEQNDFSAAEKLLERASAAGVAPESLQKMVKATASHAKWHTIQIALAIASLVLLFAGVAVAGRALVRASKSKGPPSDTEHGASAVDTLPPVDAKG